MIIDIDDALLHDWPLPMPSDDGDKEERGRILVVGGSREMPGAAVLAANAALRAGAGKLAIATGVSTAQAVAIAVPEAQVIGLPETSAGGFVPDSARSLEPVLAQADAVLVGPGMQDEQAVAHFVRELLPFAKLANIVLDAYAMSAVQESDMKSAGRVLLTPHAGEMAHLCGIGKGEVTAAPGAHAQRMAAQWNAIVTLKGAETFIAAPDGAAWRHRGGDIGLAVSGSGDTLAGIIAGLAARGAPLAQAAAWGVRLHARAGEALAHRFGPLGYLAREIPGEIPRLLRTMQT